MTDYTQREPCKKLIETFKDGERFTATYCAQILNCDARDLSSIMSDFEREGFISAAVKNLRGNTWQKGLSDANKALDAFNFNHKLESVK